jgi:hypothetical protein
VPQGFQAEKKIALDTKKFSLSLNSSDMRKMCIMDKNQHMQVPERTFIWQNVERYCVIHIQPFNCTQEKRRIEIALGNSKNTVNIKQEKRQPANLHKTAPCLVPCTIYLFGKTEGVPECPACSAAIYGVKTQDVK